MTLPVVGDAVSDAASAADGAEARHNEQGGQEDTAETGSTEQEEQEQVEEEEKQEEAAEESESKEQDECKEDEEKESKRAQGEEAVSEAVTQNSTSASTPSEESKTVPHVDFVQTETTISIIVEAAHQDPSSVSATKHVTSFGPVAVHGIDLCLAQTDTTLVFRCVAVQACALWRPGASWGVVVVRIGCLW